MRSYEFHPLANDYPLMAEEQLEELAQEMRDFGFDPAWPIVLWDGKILDGRNRYLAARRAGVEPAFVARDFTPDEAAEFVEMANLHRRHLTAEWLSHRRKGQVEARLARTRTVARLRSEGLSYQAIANKTGVTKTQVRYDLGTAEMLGIPVTTPDRVIGTDGRCQSATKPRRMSAAPEDEVQVVRRLPQGQVRLVISGATFDLSMAAAKVLHRQLGDLLREPAGK